MKVNAPDALVGAIAFEYVWRKVKPQLEEDPDFRGAFHVLSGFSIEQLIGFIRARDTAGVRAQRMQLQFPAAELVGFGVDPSHLTADSSVDVRNRERRGMVVITAEVENDAEASLADSDRTDASDLKDRSIAHIWVEFVGRGVGLNLQPDEQRQVEAMVRGLFETGRCPTAKTGEYLDAVLRRCHAGETLTRAAGQSLPAIGLPRFEDCFSSLNEAKMMQASHWAAKFRTHYALECYIHKRGLSQELLDTELLRSRMAQLSSTEHQPPMPEEILAAFSDYIESDGMRNEATEKLLFEHDWSYVTHCFDRAKKTPAKDFAERTKNALIAEGIEITPDDQLVIDALTKIARKPGSADPEFREFFERRREALEKDSPLYLEWEDFVHGKKVECCDLYQGLFECLQRLIRGLSSSDTAYIVLEGRQQKKPNHFMELNQRACEYFERAYGSLEARTKRRIRFADTLVCQYSKEVLPIVGDKKKFKGTSKAGKATALNFLVSVFQKEGGDSERKVGTLSLTWRFPVGSVLAQEVVDFDALCRFHAKRHTTLVECVAEYEVVGRKGVPVSLSLESVEGFAEAARSGGRGSFVPAQDRIKSLTAAWKELVDTATLRRWLPSEQLIALGTDFAAFESLYGDAIFDLRKNVLATEKVPAMAGAYRKLLLTINAVKHQDARRQFLRILLRVGLTQVQRSGRRPPMAIACPWHPLRMEAAVARQQQLLGLLDQLLGKSRPPFSDGANGGLFFREVDQLLTHPLYPECTPVWEGTQCMPRVVTQAFGAYTLHQPPEPADEQEMTALDDDSKAAAATIEAEMHEYLRLQPHQRDNLSILLYECDSPDLPVAVVEAINSVNATREDDKITCQVLLMHRDEDHLRKIYRDLVARGVDADADPTEASGDFLAKVRVNITAANRLRREGRTQPVDLAYCRDLISGQADPVWEWLTRETYAPEKLQPHQWSRRLPVTEGDRKVRLQLVCPAQTETGWAYLYTLAFLCANGADEAWGVGKCPVLMRCLDFDERHVDRIFKDTHDLATWVINQDELLDRKLLEAHPEVRVIRYVQSATHGRNLIISSGARDTLLFNTLKEKLRALLSSDVPTETIEDIGRRFIADANKISGGLVLKAARRANNTNELLGMVLTRYIVQSQLGGGRPIAWCFLDDYSQWLGKKEGANIADLLVLAPKTNPDGTLHLDIIVTEAKFVKRDNATEEANHSSKQLIDTLSQLTEAIDGEAGTIDQDIWLARLSDLLVAQTVVPPGVAAFDGPTWRRAIRHRQCTVSILGYSHVFVHEPHDLSASVTSTKGIVPAKGRQNLEAFQEILGPTDVRALVVQYHHNDHRGTAELRLRNGHPPFGETKLYHLASQSERKASSKSSASKKNPPPDAPPETPPILPTGPTQSPPPASAPPSTETRPDTPAQDLIGFLESRAALFQTSEEKGRAWLEQASTDLRRSLVTRGLRAVVAQGAQPILTPNAGIIKLQGSKDLTVQAVESHADEIFTSEGIKIINVSPESGRVSIAVERPQRQVLHTEQVLLDYIRSYQQGNLGEKICVGIREEDGLPLLLDPLNQPHTLIAGITGSGKSVLVQNLILTLAASRSPEEAHLYLIDPKFGVDYRPLDELPHVKAGSGGIIDDASTAVKILDGLVAEMNRRYELFKEAKVPNVHAYRRATGKPLPTLWVIHDEFADWMQTEDYAKAVPAIVGRLSVKARAAGIFLVFAAQRPDKDVMPMQLRSQLGNRLILKVDNAATAEIAMGSKNSGAERLLGRGHMLAKIGDMPEPLFAQVPFVDIERVVPEIVQLIKGKHGVP